MAVRKSKIRREVGHHLDQMMEAVGDWQQLGPGGRAVA
jgi:hypothetical protein